ncbi:hypothetical protein Clacol_009859 [Clathrus columnatus]|uniref:Bicarbonate transporter-like transmembrane domain-containing protein n=1 Tax=Clathrus columnatus TaxID=1419009 RepID=A0AAV5AS05_9AGAM|nr:hypothetical protein Clacol_009859 [Clathrus columnatus]
MPDIVNLTHDEPPDLTSISSQQRFRFNQVLGFVPSVHPFRGIFRDIKARAPYYASDWIDAWNYRVLPATALTFFSNIFPGIAFSLDLIETTQQYGVAEVLLSSFMAAAVFSLFGAQPLCIAGVTGPITVLNKTIFDVVANRAGGPDYLQFVGWVYLQYGIQILTRQFHSTTLESAYVSIILALLMLILSITFRALSQSALFHQHIRRLFADYGMPISIVVTSAVAYWGHLNTSNPDTLPVGGAFQAAGRRAWLVRFWELEAKWVGIAFPFGLVLWVLFFFDHNVSSLMAQGSKFPLKKPPGFHYDFFLLGITTFIAGLLGLIPQAPIHTQSLVVLGSRPKLPNSEEKSTMNRSGTVTPNAYIGNPNLQDLQSEEGYRPASTLVPVAVVEQRVSNLAQGALCLVLLTGPLLRVLGLIPRGKLFSWCFSRWYMGLDALSANGITGRILFLIHDSTLSPQTGPLLHVRKSRIILFTVIELIGFGATMGIVQTVAAIGFPVIIMLLIPIRAFIIPHLPFYPEELAILDGPTASPFTMASVGGSV